MTDREVKRTYRSPVRAGQAEQTKAAIRDAASALFVRDGFAATSMKAIAAAAGVAERTPYVVFESKRDLFLHCVGVAIAGDTAPVAVGDRSELAAAMADPDPREAIRRVLALGCDLLDRAGELIFVGIEASGSDPVLREVAEQGAKDTHALHRRFAEHLAGRGALRPGLDADAAADVLYALGASHVHRLLRVDRGWSSDRFRAWLTATVTGHLLPDGGDG